MQPLRRMWWRFIQSCLSWWPVSCHFSPAGFKVLFFFMVYNLFFYFEILFIYFYSVTIVCLFSPSLHPTPAEPPPSPTSALPLDFVLVSFLVAPIDPSPHYPLPTSFWLVGSAGVGWRDGEKRHINII